MAKTAHADMNHGRARVTAHKAKPTAAKRTKSMTIRRADNGGYIAENTPDGDEPWGNSKTHVFANAKAMHAHVASSFNDHDGDEQPANRQEDGEQA